MNIFLDNVDLSSRSGPNHFARKLKKYMERQGDTFTFAEVFDVQLSFIEVKNVTLSRKKSVAEFPDAVTSRGLKHIKELIKAKKKGFDIYLLFLIQRDDCNNFNLAKDIDPEYCELLVKAVKKNLNVLCYDCKFSSKGIKLNRKIKFNI